MRYSHGMHTAPAEAPEIYPGYPYKRRLWPAWQAMWDGLVKAGPTYQDGTVLARQVAGEHGLAAATMQAILTRAAAAGLLDRESREVPVDVVRKRPSGSTFTIPGRRKRTFYRIKSV